jgi:tetratricopeptide (TPR) repeat protein
MKHTISLTILLIFAICVSGIGQTRKQFLKAAQTAYDQQNYYAALKYYEEALTFDSAQVDVWYQYGEAARQFNAYTLAEKSYQYVLDQNATATFPLAKYRLAGVKKNLGKYADALSLYQQVLADTAVTDTKIKEIAQKEIESCEWAVEVVSNPDDNIEIVRLGDEVNTPYSEFGAEKIGKNLFYTSFSFVKEDDRNDPPRHFNKILLSDNGKAGEFWDDINSAERHTAHVAFSKDGSRVYFTYCDYVSEARVQCELYYRQREASGAWSKPIRLPDFINLKGYTTSEPHVSQVTGEAEERLYFSSDRPGGKGGMDIWVAKILTDGNFSQPENLSAINTDGDDITPFLHRASQVLYFSNNSRQGLGGFDVFKSKKEGENWSEPVHMGYPLNSSYDDLHFKLSPGSAYAYFSSNRLGSTYLEKEKEACCHDIYSMQTLRMELLALTYDAWSKEPVKGVTVTLKKLGPGKPGTPDTQTNLKGNDFQYTIDRGGYYLVTADVNGYHPYHDTIYLDQDSTLDLTSITREIYLEPAEVILNALVFDDYTKRGLIGATVQLFEVDGDTRKQVQELTNENGNDFQFKLQLGKSYILRGTKNGYEHDLDTLPFLGPELRQNRVLNRELYLTPLIFAEFLPLTLYFDNDEPDPDVKTMTTRQSYLGTWDKYYGRKTTFLDEFGKGMTPDMKFLANQRLEDFFEREVRSGGIALGKFSELMLVFLQQGNNLEVVLRGYTSPRAESDYNDNLSKRRISCVRNHFESFNGGIFKPYIANGQFVIKEKPYGETKSKPDVSDKLNDVRNSIYGVPASLERRVEIIDVRQADDF